MRRSAVPNFECLLARLKYCHLIHLPNLFRMGQLSCNQTIEHFYDSIGKFLQKCITSQSFNPYKLLSQNEYITNADILRATLSLFTEIQSLKSEQTALNQRSDPPKIPEPTCEDGKYKLDGNAPFQIMQYIEKHNQNPDEQLKYVEFPKNAKPGQSN